MGAEGEPRRHGDLMKAFEQAKKTAADKERKSSVLDGKKKKSNNEPEPIKVEEKLLDPLEVVKTEMFEHKSAASHPAYKKASKIGNTSAENVAKQGKLRMMSYGEYFKSLCEYFCRICKEECWSEHEISRHLKAVHHEVTLKQYEKHYGPLITKKVTHKCCLCNQEVLHTVLSINKHIQHRHTMKPSIYYYKYVVKATLVRSRGLANTVKKGKQEGTLNSLEKMRSEKPEKHEEYSVSHPSYINMVKKAIACNSNRQGSSRQRILKYIIDNYNVQKDIDRVNTWVKLTLRQYTADGTLKRIGNGYGAKGSFKLARPEEHPIKIEDPLLTSFDPTKQEVVEDEYQENLNDRGPLSHCETCKWIGPSGSYEEHIEKEHGRDVGVDLTMQNICDFANDAVKLEDSFEHYVANGCEYSCRICSEKCTSETEIIGHLGAAHHGITTEQYVELYGPLMTKEVKHTCVVCYREVLHARKNMLGHLRRHKINPSKYYHKYIMASENMRGKMSLFKGEDKLEFCADVTHDKDWFKQCRFDCRACENKQRSHPGLSSHIKKVHNIDDQEYVETYGPLMSVKKKHRCKICGVYLLSMKKVICTHMCMHNLSLNEYSSKYMDVKISEEANVKSYNEQAVDSTFEQCEYTCGICGKKFQVHCRLWTHVGKAHKDITLRDYKDKYGQCQTKTVMHRCRICDKELLHVKAKISSHLWKIHSCVSLTEYKEKYLADSDDIIDGECSRGTIVIKVPWEGVGKDEEVSETT